MRMDTSTSTSDGRLDPSSTCRWGCYPSLHEWQQVTQQSIQQEGFIREPKDSYDTSYCATVQVDVHVHNEYQWRYFSQSLGSNISCSVLPPWVPVTVICDMQKPLEKHPYRMNECSYINVHWTTHKWLYHYDYNRDCHLSLRVVQNFYTSQSLRSMDLNPPKWRPCQVRLFKCVI